MGPQGDRGPDSPTSAAKTKATMWEISAIGRRPFKTVSDFEGFQDSRRADTGAG